MTQTREELETIYAAWMLGAEVESKPLLETDNPWSLLFSCQEYLSIAGKLENHPLWCAYHQVYKVNRYVYRLKGNDNESDT